MKTTDVMEDGNGSSMGGQRVPEIGADDGTYADPIFENQTGVSSDHMRHPTMNTEAESFLIEPADPWQEARTMASDVFCRLLIWIADGRTLKDRGLRACVALYCVRPDLIGDMTLDGIGVLAGCSRQAVHKLAIDFRRTTGLQP